MSDKDDILHKVNHFVPNLLNISDASKTPPCVLRKNAKAAEKNLKDIVELTNREKMYNPDVVSINFFFIMSTLLH